MLTLQEIKEYIPRFSYKDWSIRVWEGQYEGRHIGFRAEVPDAYNPGETVKLDVNVLLPPIPNLDYLKEFLFWRLKQIEIHECMEYFKFDDRIVFDPHRDFADRDEDILF
jgi:hypothetical protein